MIELTRPLFVLDTETTGTDVKADRIVELGFQQFVVSFPEGLIKEYRTLINPGILIPKAAMKIHGITNDAVVSCRVCGYYQMAHPVKNGELGVEECEEYKPWPMFQNLATNYAKGFSNCDFAGKRVRFDLQILAAEMKRAGIEWNYVGARIIDIDRLEQIAVPRTLSHLHEKYVGLKHDGAHGALSDVRASTTVIVKQLEAHASLPRDLDQLHQLSWPGWLTEDGSFSKVDGVAICQFGKHRGKAMRDVPIDYYDFIIKNDFPADVKALAREAKLGRFPE